MKLGLSVYGIIRYILEPQVPLIIPQIMANQITADNNNGCDWSVTKSCMSNPTSGSGLWTN